MVSSRGHCDIATRLLTLYKASVNLIKTSRETSEVVSFDVEIFTDVALKLGRRLSPRGVQISGPKPDLASDMARQRGASNKSHSLAWYHAVVV